MNGVGLDELEGEPSATPGSPVMSKKLRYDLSNTTVNLTASYQTIYSYTGSGKLKGFLFDFESTNTDVKLTIDSTEVIFDIKMINLGTISANKEFAVGGLFTGPAFKKLALDLDFPVVFDSEVKVEAKESGGKKLFGYLVALTKET